MRVTSAPSAAQDRAEPPPDRAATTAGSTPDGTGSVAAGEANTPADTPADQDRLVAEEATDEAAGAADEEADRVDTDGSEAAGEAPPTEVDPTVRTSLPARLAHLIRLPAMRDLAVCL